MHLIKSILLISSFALTATVWGAEAVKPERHDIDPVHSSVTFQVRHLVSKLPGNFSEFSGFINFVPSNINESKVSAKVKVNTVSTNNAKRDAHLNNPDFFATAQYPDATFESTSWKQVAENKYEVIGDLTIRGATRQTTFQVTHAGTQVTPEKTVGGWSAIAGIKRSDFGIDYGSGMIGDDVTITIELETIVKK